MDLTPPLGNLGEHLIMRSADHILVPQAEVGQPPLADRHIAHVAIKHGNGCRNVLKEQCKAFFVFPQGRLDPPSFLEFLLQALICMSQFLRPFVYAAFELVPGPSPFGRVVKHHHAAPWGSRVIRKRTTRHAEP